MDKEFKVLQRIIQAATMRQKILASNIANADTPGYKAKDVKFGNFLREEMKLLTTNSKHISSNSGDAINGTLIVQQTPSWGDRNNVELNTEVAKMTENALLHDAAIKILNIKIKMFRNAISVRGR
jgi:flagellar basal-body rod protein FlgB